MKLTPVIGSAMWCIAVVIAVAAHISVRGQQREAVRLAAGDVVQETDSPERGSIFADWLDGAEPGDGAPAAVFVVSTEGSVGCNAGSIVSFVRLIQSMSAKVKPIVVGARDRGEGKSMKRVFSGVTVAEAPPRI